MDPRQRIDQALERALGRTTAPGAPPLLAQAMRHAVFPGGGRFRPRLTLGVALACGDDAPELTDAAAVAIEMLHCASLVHDDLPCFDDADMRRGQPSVHKAFGEPLAVLAGDGLILLSFQNLAEAAALHPQRLGTLVSLVADAVGVPNGIVAGQAWESEPEVEINDYQRAKTAALFAAATMAGAAAAGGVAADWRILGERLGEAYQVADDLRDVASDPETLGKPVGQDAALGRPNAVAQFGVAGAVGRLKGLIDEAVTSIPDCAGAQALRALIRKESESFLPQALASYAA
ncbi:polyprenyl synthetase family protein [Pararhodospirillum photometricum]|nr:polyprenyl synthetase family protein [Pararhodospirillum photometricum]